MKLHLKLSQLELDIKPVTESPAGHFTLKKRGWILMSAFLVVLSIATWAFYFNQQLTLSYNDARSHLNVARRVIDSLQPGAAQIGSVWLPLFHILELPFIWNDYLWHTGIAGSIISMVSFLIGGIYILKICQRLHFDFPTTLVSFGVFALNPNLLFIQATPMTESLLLCLCLATAYYIIKWAENGKPATLITAGFTTFLASLTRYDGWFLLAFVAGIVGFISFKKKRFSYAEGNVLLYVTLAGFGVFLWLLWNLAIFGNPLYFATGPFSAKAQQDVLVSEGRLMTKGNLIYSTVTYLFAAQSNLGAWVSILSIGGLWYLSRSKRYSWQVKLALLTLLAPLFFNIISLFAGQSAIYLPTLPPYTWFNDRYGLMLLPAAAIFVGILINGKRTAIILAALILLIQIQVMYVGNNIITIEDGVRGASAEFQDSAGNWIASNVQSGLILVAASSNDALMFRSGLPLKHFITEGAQKYWQTSLEDPTRYADWIIMHKGDLVEKNLRTNPSFLNNYQLVYHDSFSYIYKKELGAQRLTSDTLP